MSYLPLTLLAYFFNSLSVLANKFLLSKAIPDPLVYVFYISLFSLLALFALPFTLTPSPFTLILASLSTIFWTIGAYFMFKALKSGQVSRVIPIIGTLIPLILLFFSFNSLSQIQIWTVFLLIAGMVALTGPDWKGGLTKQELLLEIVSSISFALAYLLLRQAYLRSDFFSVIVWSRVILIPLVFILGLFLSLRGVKATKQSLLNKIASLPSVARNDEALLFLGGQIAGVLSEFLILFSISLASPALVNSLQGTQYIFIFIFTLILSQKYPQILDEQYNFLNLVSKLVGIVLIGIGLYLLSR